MQEWKRCLIQKKNLLLLCLLLMVNVAFVFAQCNDTQVITKQGEELEAYLAEYPDYVASTLENAEDMKLLGMLSDKESFAYRNVLQTVEDFSRMQEVRLQAGENRGVVIFSGLELTNFLLVGYGIYLVMLFTGEYKKGLSLLVFSTAKGRRSLGIKRVGILLAGLFFCAVLLYGSSLLTVCICYPGLNPARPIQSVPEFMKCTMSLSVGEYLVCYAVVKYLAAVVISLLLFGCIALFRNALATILAGLALLGEGLAYGMILPTADNNWLKFLNLFGILQGNDGFGYYLNLNFFGKPVALLSAQLGFLVFFLVLFMGISVYAQGKKAPEGIGWIRRLTDRILCFYQNHKPAMPGFFWEAHKILFSQRGLLILAVILYLAISASMKTQYGDFRSRAEMMYYKEYSGDVSAEKLKEAQKQEEKLTRHYNNAVKNVEKLEAAGGDENAGALAISEMRIRELELKLPALRRILDNMESEVEYSTRTGNEVSIIEPFGYEMLLVTDVKTYQRNLLYCLICVILVFSGVMSVEKTSGTGLLLHSLPKGRKAVLCNKLIWVVILAMGVSLPIHLIQLVLIGKVIPFENLSQPVQSLQILRDFPFYITIRSYLIGLYTVRCLFSAGVGAAVMFLSSRCKNRVSCMALCMVLLMAGVFAVVLL